MKNFKTLILAICAVVLFGNLAIGQCESITINGQNLSAASAANPLIVQQGQPLTIAGGNVAATVFIGNTGSSVGTWNTFNGSPTTFNLPATDCATYRFDANDGNARNC